MAATVTKVGTNPTDGGTNAPSTIGPARFAVADITLDASYPTGGYTITPQQLGLTRFLAYLNAEPKSVEAHNVVNVGFTESSGALQAYTTAAEVANGTNLSGVTVRLVVLGY